MSNLLMSSSYWVLNKAIVKKFGMNSALLLAELSFLQEVFSRKGQLSEDNSFFRTKSQIEDSTGLSPYEQAQCIKVLVKNKLVFYVKKGVPAKIFYRVDNEMVNQMIIKCLKESDIDYNGVNT